MKSYDNSFFPGEGQGLYYGYQKCWLEPHKSSRHRRYVTSLTGGILSIVFFLFMAVLNFSQNNYTNTAILMLCIFICVLAILLQLATANAALSSWLLCVTHIMLSWYLIALGGKNVGSLVWTFIYPQAFMLWLGLYQGTALSIFYLGSVIALTLGPLAQFMPNNFSHSVALHYCTSLAAMLIFVFFLEYVRNRLQSKLFLLNEQMRNTALTDHLTGLGNRLAFEQHLDAEYAHFLRHGNDFAIIMCDIDNFKNINDRHGHAVGDAVLQHTAELLTHNIRGQDAIFRWGGEEFVITMADIPPSELFQIAEGLRQAVADNPCRYKNDIVFCTMSFGAHSCNVLETYTQAMEAVDRLMYAAKRAGRNKVMVNDTPY